MLPANPKPATISRLTKNIEIKKVRHYDQSNEAYENKKRLVPLRGKPPEIPLFLNAIVKKGIQEETIFEFKVTYPDGQQLVTNMRLRAEDIELWKEISEAVR